MRPEVKYRVIYRHKDKYSINEMCRFFEVSRSGYYGFVKRMDRPIYIDGDPIKGSYRRNGDGDCHCTKDEAEAMLRDAAGRSQDMLVLENMGMYVFDYDSVIRQCCSEGSFSTLRYTFDISRSVRHIFF